MSRNRKRPAVDHGECNLCEGCITVCPSVFFMNELGFVDVVNMEEYPEAEVDEAIMMCPEDCISWEE